MEAQKLDYQIVPPAATDWAENRRLSRATVVQESHPRPCRASCATRLSMEIALFVHVGAHRKNHELDYRPRSRDTADPEKLKFSNGVVEYLLFRGGLVDAPSLPSAACTCTGWLTSAGRLDPHGRAPAGVAISGSTLRLPRGQADPNSPILTRDPSNA